MNGVVRSHVERMLRHPSIRFFLRLFSDNTLGLEEREEAYIKLIQTCSGRAVYADRFWEWRSFFGVSWLAACLFFLRYGWPFSSRLRTTLLERFLGRTSAERLKHAYQDATIHYSALLMLSMHRTQWFWPFIPRIEKEIGILGSRVLEYGCGMSDVGLVLAKLGAQVTIVDLSGGNLEFAQWRYRIRGLNCGTIPIIDTESYPSLPRNEFDLVVATEILEHVRDPLHLLRLLTGTLRSGGLLYCSMGLSFEREVEGDHLPEAVAIGNSGPYREYFRSNYKLICEPQGHPWLFRRRD